MRFCIYVCLIEFVYERKRERACIISVEIQVYDKCVFIFVRGCMIVYIRELECVCMRVCMCVRANVCLRERERER